jgi:hypothetical protein
VIVVAIKLGFIAPVVPTTGGVGQDEERAASGEAGRGEAARGWWRTDDVGLVAESGGAGRD